MASFHFWIVNPNAAQAERWEAYLRREGWTVGRAATADAFLSGASPNEVGLALVDWAALGSGPMAALRSLKAKAPAVSIVLTSGPDISNDQIIETLEAGVDDHFPHSIPEDLLRAKLRAHLRRILPSLATALNVLKTKSGDLKLDRSRWEVWVRGRGGKLEPCTAFTRTEMQLLALFLERPGAAMERSFIVETVWKDEAEEIRLGTVDKHIESLRKKLGRMGGRIQTVYGVGYAFRDEG